MKKKAPKKDKSPVKPEDQSWIDALEEAKNRPAKGAGKPNEDAQDGDWSGDRDYEVD